MAIKLSVDDWHDAARRRLPRLVLDYVDGGAETESTTRANVASFDRVTLRPRGGVDATSVDISTTLLGHPLSMPLFLAPCGMARIVHPGGDRAGASAAAAKGTVFVQSTMSGHPVEEVVSAGGGSPVWYQAYQVGTRETAARAIARARAAGAEALVVTIDSAVGSLRERDRRSGGMALLGKSKVRAAPHFLRLAGSPTWFVRHLADGLHPKLMNVIDESGVPALLGRGAGPRGLGWRDLEWIRPVWDGPIVIKGVLTPDDAERAIAEGAAAIEISNHGGRQLDTADATLVALPEIASTVAGRCPVIFDGGVRRGTDVLKALCLGADAVAIGRAWLYGLAVGGQRGIEEVLEIFSAGIARNLALLGATSLDQLGPQYVRSPFEWGAPPERRHHGAPARSTIREAPAVVPGRSGR